MRINSASIDSFVAGMVEYMSQEIKAQKGDLVRVHYVGKFQGGRVFDTSMEKEAIKAGIYNPSRDYKPLSVIIGKGQVIPGFEEALIGMRLNEEKEVIIPPSKGYGAKGNHPLAGKTLVFRIKMVEIKREKV
jgi:FKBP-type peptidyl-prolyl cis-trans isomerase FkpA